MVDPATTTVALRNVEVLRFDPGTVVIVEQGLDGGDIVVTAGVQALHPGQKVRLLGRRVMMRSQSLGMGAQAPLARRLSS